MRSIAMDQPFSRPRKRFGQNFLHDRSVIDRILDELDLSAATHVLEIGPGRGALTGRLLERSDRVVAVEIDRDLAQRLREGFDPDRLDVLEGDILDLDLERLAVETHGRSARWTVAGNLPYNISKPIAMKLVESVASIDKAVLMFQREVAQRFLAARGSADYGPLSVLPRAVYQIDRVIDVQPGAFRPRPTVVSTVTRWTARPAAERPTEIEMRRLRAVLKATFANRRKTLKNNLRSTLGSDELLERSGLDGTRRAQELSPAELQALAALWPLD